MTSELVAVTSNAQDPGRLARFWANLLDRDVVADPDGARLPGDDAQVGLRFVAAPRRAAGRTDCTFT